MNKMIITTFVGAVVGAVVATSWLHHTRVTQPKPMYGVGDCLSNGLFFERVDAIRQDGWLGERLYVTRQYIDGRKRNPSTVAVFVADKHYVVVESDYCKEDGK